LHLEAAGVDLVPDFGLVGAGLTAISRWLKDA